MSKKFFLLLTVSVFFFSCRKEQFQQPVIAESCAMQSDNPAGRSYSWDSLQQINYTKQHCGLLPLSCENVWIYEDSIFDNGSFLRVQYDTLRYSKTIKSVNDGLIWWEGKSVAGLPDRINSTDSSLFVLENRLFIPGFADAKQSYSLFPGDSVRYLTSFGDVAAQGRSVRIPDVQHTPAGSFSDCILFDKNARNYRREQLVFKPGVGVVKFIYEEAPMGTRVIKMQKISTLISYSIK